MDRLLENLVELLEKEEKFQLSWPVPRDSIDDLINLVNEWRTRRGDFARLSEDFYSKDALQVRRMFRGRIPSAAVKLGIRRFVRHRI